MTLTMIRGNQTPSVVYPQPYVSTDADLAVDLVQSYAGTPDEWQKYCLDLILGKRENGLWCANTVGISVPRQNGKNYILEVFELYVTVILGLRVYHTAQEERTSREHFKRMKKYFEDVPELRREVKKISNTNGDFHVELHNGGMLYLGTRTKNASRGFSVDILIMDEAQHLDSEALEALGPIISASKNPMQIFTGTPPGPSMSSEVFSNLRKHGVDQSMPLMIWLEWSADDDADLDSEEAWAQANPGYPLRISKETIQRERATNVNDDAFARERLGMWPQKASTGVIDMKQWLDLTDNKAQMENPVVFGLHVNADRDRASICAAGYSRKLVDGQWEVRTHIDVVTEVGTTWVVDKMAELAKTHRNFGVVIDNKSQAAALKRDLQRAKVRVIELNFPERARADADFLEAIQLGNVSHGNQEALTEACAIAEKRWSNEQWLWSNKTTGGDITPLVASSMAYSVLAKKKTAPTDKPADEDSPVKPKRKGRATVLR
jgi:hypothetical protein